MDNLFDPLTRREALRRAAMLAGGVMAAPLLAGCPRPGTEGAVGEGTAARAAGTAQPGRPVGLQLYSVRHQLEPDAAGTLQQVAQIGYNQVETYDTQNINADEFGAVLRRNGLVTPSGHFGIDALRQNLDASLAVAQALGQRWVIVPWLVEGERNQAGYSRVAADLNRFGQATRERGLRVAYHNHEFEFERLEGGRSGMDILLAETDPALVDFELDLFWTVHAGHDPLEFLTRHQGRMPLWHVKDMADIRGEKRMVPVGQGEIDFGQLFARAEELGLQHFYVEHDDPEDPTAFLRTSYQHVSQLLS